jgi:NADH-quinone oxidoreductase subunit H
LRYDQFMSFGWKYLIPISLVWLMAVAAFRLGNREGWFSTPTFWVIAGIILVGLIVLTFVGGEEEEAPDVAPSGPFDAFAGGYPVPPQGDQQLPELAGVLAGEGEEQTPPPQRAARPMPGPPEQAQPEPTTREEQS